MASQDRWRQDEREQRYRSGDPSNRNQSSDWGRDFGRDRDWERDEDRYRDQDRSRDFGGVDPERRLWGSGSDRNCDESRGGMGNRDRGYGSDYGRRGDEWGRQDTSRAIGAGSDSIRRQGYGQGDRDYRGSGSGYGFGDQDRNRDWQQRGGEERSFWDRATDEVSSWFGDRDAERRREEDHRGRGPKGYKRSDDRIRDDLNDRLADDRFIDASDIEVMVAAGEVTLTGTVANREMRRQAEDLAERISGVTYVQNNLRVSRGGSSTDPAASTLSSSASGTGTMGGSTSVGGTPGSIGTVGTGGTPATNGGTTGSSATSERTRGL